MIKIEMTDTFGGEANYSWIIRADDEKSFTLSQALRRFKRNERITAKHDILWSDGLNQRVKLRKQCVIIDLYFEQ